METFRKIIAGLLITFFIPIFILTIFSLTARLTIFSPKFYETTLDKNKVYNKIVQTTLPILTKQIIPIDTGTELISSEDISNIATNAIKPDWITTQLDIFTSAIADFLVGNKESLNREISFIDLKNNLQISLNDIIENKIQSLPNCELSDQIEILNWQNIKTGNIRPTCNILGSISNDANKELTTSISQEMVNKIPDKISLNQLKINIGWFDWLLETTQKIIKIYTGILIFLFVVDLFFLLAIFYLIYRPLSSALKWIATAISIPSIIVFILSLFSFIILFLAQNNSYIPTDPGTKIIALAISIFDAFLKQIINYNLLFSSICIIISILLFIWAYKIKRK